MSSFGDLSKVATGFDVVFVAFDLLFGLVLHEADGHGGGRTRLCSGWGGGGTRFEYLQFFEVGIIGRV